MRKTLSKFLLVLLGTAFTLLGLEATARVLVRLGVVDYWRPMKTVRIEGTDDWRLNHITADDLREPDPELFWKPVARSPYNAQRFKGPLMAVPKPREVFRILCYGDSNTDGPKQGSWPEVLQELLNQHPVARRSSLRSRQRRSSRILIPPRTAPFSAGSKDVSTRPGDRVVRLERRSSGGRSRGPRISPFMAASSSPAGALQITSLPCPSREYSFEEFYGDRP